MWTSKPHWVEKIVENVRDLKRSRCIRTRQRNAWSSWWWQGGWIWERLRRKQRWLKTSKLYEIVWSFHKQNDSFRSLHLKVTHQQWYTCMYRLWCRKFVFVDNCSAYSWINIEFQILFSTRKFLFGRKYPLFWWDLTCCQFNLFAKIARLIGK